MTTTRPRIGFKSLLLPALLLSVSVASAQQAAEPPATAPAPNQPAFEPIPWGYERTQANQAGTVSSTHRYRLTEDGSQTYREHVVTDPRREMVQSRERSMTDNGYTYRRQHVWTNPDGTPLRSHQWTTTGTDPNNYDRSRTFQRAWAPNGQATDGPSFEGQTPGGPSTFSLTAPLHRPPSAVAAKPEPKPSYWSKWNPFAKKPHTDISTATTRIASSPAPRRGFTVGSHGGSYATPKRPGVTDRNPGHSQGAARRQSMEHRRIRR